jgi:hypothetical protein
MVGVDTASIQASSTLPGIVVSNRDCVRLIERRPKAKRSGSSVICGRAFGFHSPADWPRRVWLSIERRPIWRSNAGCARWRTLAFTAPPARFRPKDWSAKRLQLQQVPTPYGGRTVRALQAPPEPAPIIGMQHPLSLYDVFAGGVR